MEYPVTVSFRCEAEVNRRIRIEAAKRDMNRSEFILMAIAEKLEKIDEEDAVGTVLVKG